MSLTYTHRPGGSAYCPECREAISKEANVCPHCRSDLRENEAWQEAKASGGCAMVLIGGILLVGGVALGVGNWVV